MTDAAPDSVGFPRLAGAVGEGSAAIRSIHQYLDQGH